MPPIVPNWLSRVAEFGRWLAVVLALAGQVGAGAMAEPAQSPRAMLAAAMVLCLGGNHTGKDGAPPVHHHPPGPVLAAATHHVVHDAAILDGSRFLPAPSPHFAIWTGLPATRGPPGQPLAAFYPTGPPHHLS